MSALRYDKIDAIRASITQMEDLVAIFSRADGLQLLQVYNSESPPPTSGTTEAITLRELPGKDGNPD